MRRRLPLLVVFTGFLLFLRALLPHRRSTVLRLAPIHKKIRIKKHLPYLTDGHPKHRLDLYLPARKTNFPVILFVHGGYWNTGDKDYYPRLTGLYSSIGRCLAARGIGVTIQSYRLVPEVQIDGQVDDVRQAYGWLTKNIKARGGNPRHIFLMGHSAGALLTMLLAMDLSYLEKTKTGKILPKGYISLSGIVDVEQLPQVNDKQLQKILKHAFGEGPDNLKRLNPLTYIRRHLPATLLLVGSRDEAFIIKNTEEGLEKLREHGNIPLYHLIEPNDHRDMVLRIGSKQDNVSDHIETFIKNLTT